jgi:hypothetical protein
MCRVGAGKWVGWRRVVSRVEKDGELGVGMYSIDKVERGGVYCRVGAGLWARWRRVVSGVEEGNR